MPTADVDRWRKLTAELRRLAAMRETRVGTVLLDLADNPDHWRKRAEEMRSLAKETKDEVNIARLLTLAADYDHLANQAEVRALSLAAAKGEPPPEL